MKKQNKIIVFFKVVGKIIYNFFFCLKYPFMRYSNTWTGKKLGFRYTWYDDLAPGWKKAFGKQLLKELKQAIKKDSIKNFYFTEIKEKYGTLRLYTSTSGENTNNVIDKYELLSMCYCMNCGKPVRYITRGWVNYLCEDCIKYEYKDQDDIDACRVTKKDIPESFRYISNGKAVKVDYKTEYGVDFYELWGLK